MRIAPGTPGESTCLNLWTPNQCGVLADVLGDAVVWFALVPQAPRQTAELPPIVDLDEGYAVFEQRMADRVRGGDRAGVRRRRHPALQRLPASTIGPDSVSVVDLNKQEVTTTTTHADQRLAVSSTGSTATSPPTGSPAKSSPEPLLPTRPSMPPRGSTSAALACRR